MHTTHTGSQGGAPFVDPLAGTPFRALAELGRGGMGVVYDAIRTSDGARVAVKCLSESVAPAVLVDRLRLEAETLARLEHPNVVRFVDLGVTATKRPYYAMERLHGASLAARLAEHGPVSVDHAVALVRPLLLALGAAHALGVIHRDVTERNVFLVDGPQGPVVKLLDFGIAKVLAEAAAVSHAPAPLAFPTAEGVLVGSIDALAPEQLIGPAISPATDLYAIGCLLYRMTTGARPFGDRPRDAQLAAIVHERPLPPSQRTTSPIAPWFDALVMRLLAKDPRDRPRSAAEVIVALDARQEPEAIATMPAFIAPRIVDAGTAPSAARIEPRPESRAAAPSAGPRTGAVPIGLAFLAIAVPSLGFRILSAIDAADHALDPASAIRAIAPTADPTSEALLGLVGRSATIACVRHLALALSSLGLAAAAVLVLRSAKGARALRAWCAPGLVLAIAAIALDAFAIAPAQLELTNAIAGASDAGGSGLAGGLVGFASVVTAVLELAIVALAFVASRRLDTGALPVGDRSR